MTRYFIGSLAVLAIVSAAWAGTSITILDENFDTFNPASPPAGWSVKNNSDPLDDTPLVFDANGNGPDSKVVYPTPWTQGTSKSAGYTWGSEDGWDGSSPQFFEKIFTVAAGTYDLELDLDRYVYWSRTDPADQHWQVANIIFLLTDDDYDIPYDVWMGDNYWDQSLLSPSGSTRSTRWADDAAGIYNGVWEHKQIIKSITTTRGSFAFRLLLVQKDAGLQSTVGQHPSEAQTRHHRRCPNG